MKRASSLVLALVVAACAAPARQAPVQPAQPAFDPVGLYDFSTLVDGQTVNGTLTVRRNPEGQLSAVVSTPITGELPMQTVKMDGRNMELRANIEGDALIMVIEFVEDRMTGGWELGSGASGAFTGQRRGAETSGARPS